MGLARNKLCGKRETSWNFIPYYIKRAARGSEKGILFGSPAISTRDPGLCPSVFSMFVIQKTKLTFRENWGHNCSCDADGLGIRFKIGPIGTYNKYYVIVGRDEIYNKGACMQVPSIRYTIMVKLAVHVQ